MSNRLTLRKTSIKDNLQFEEMKSIYSCKTSKPRTNKPINKKYYSNALANVVTKKLVAACSTKTLIRKPKPKLKANVPIKKSPKPKKPSKLKIAATPRIRSPNIFSLKGTPHTSKNKISIKSSKQK